MAGDLGVPEALVHDTAREVLDFWFALPIKTQFARDATLDAEIARRFGDLRDRVFASNAAAWRDGPDELLAAIILLDQFSRNLYRDSPRAYEADGLAVELCLSALGKGWEERYADEERVFLYMPLQHAEEPSLQRRSLEKFAAMGDAHRSYAEGHATVIERFGRFPTRNAVLGRETTPAERAYLTEPNDGMGPPKT